MPTEVELFEIALGLRRPWEMKRVEFSSESGELHLYIDFTRGSEFACPECGSASKAYDTDADREWRHLNFFQYPTFIHARIPRVTCATCGVRTVQVPWARPGSGFTLLFEALVLTLAKHMTVGAVARLTGEHDTRLWRVLEQYVEQAREREDMSEVTHVGVDETASKRGHQYVTVCADLDRAKVLFVTEGKEANAIEEFKADFEQHHGQPEKVDAVAMDMSAAYQKGVREAFGQAMLVFDRFHVMMLINHALDEVRRLEVKENCLLQKTRYIWLKNPGNLTSRQQSELDQLLTMNLATAMAYQIKLNLQELWKLPDRETAATFLDRWFHWVMDTDIARVMKKAAKTIKAHAAGILNYFNAPITNAQLEAINSLIQAAKSKARGYRSTRYLKTIIYLIVGKLDFQLPLPLTHTK